MNDEFPQAIAKKGKIDGRGALPREDAGLTPRPTRRRRVAAPARITGAANQVPRRVKDFIDISEFTSLDDLIRYLKTIRDNLPEDH